MSGSASAAAPDPSDATNVQRQMSRPSPDAQAAGAAPPVEQTAAPPPVDQAAAPPPHARADPHADFLTTSHERDAAEARLRHAVADDVLTLDEFGDRMRLLLSARTRGDLQEAVAGLPSTGEPQPRPRQRAMARPARERQHIIAVMSEEKTHGRWRPARKTTALAIMGSAVVDLQGAEFEGDELTINAVAFMGGVEIVVPEGVEVELSGFSVMGERKMRINDDPVLPDAPLVRVDAYAVMGGVDVRHPKPKERRTPEERGAFADRVPLRAGEDDRVAVRQPRRSSALATMRRWAVGLLAAAALAVPLGWTLSSDEVAGAVFGSTDHVVTTEGLAAGEAMTVGAPVAFGSVALHVPEGVNVVRDGVVIFGSTECPACATQVDPDAPTVRVRTVGGFGSVQITRAGAPGAELD